MRHDHYIKRDAYLEKLIARRDNGEVKIITGPRRCGKSWLLSHIFRDYLLGQGVNPENIIMLDFDMDDERHDFDMLDYKAVKDYIYSVIKNTEENYYIFLDEIQELENFERLVNEERTCHLNIGNLAVQLNRFTYESHKNCKHP